MVRSPGLALAWLTILFLSPTRIYWLTGKVAFLKQILPWSFLLKRVPSVMTQIATLKTGVDST